MNRVSRKNTWITTTEISNSAGISRDKVKAWLISGKCPFGTGIYDESGNFLSFCLRKDFEKWIKNSGIVND